MSIVEKIYAEVGTIGQAIGTPNPTSNLGDVVTFVEKIIVVALDTAGILAVIIILLAAFSYATAWGDDAQAEKAKKTITWTVIGLVIIALAYGILGYINNWLLINGGK